MRVLIILFMFCVTQTFSQVGDATIVQEPITIGVANKMVGLPKLSYTVNNDGMNTYYITYNNLEYQHIDDIKTLSFIGNKDDLDKLYTFFRESFDSKDSRAISVGKERLTVNKIASSIKINVYHKEQTDGWFYLSKNQLARLFGKK